MNLGKKNNSYLWNSAWSRTLVKISAQSFSSGYFSVAFSNNNIGDSKQSTTDWKTLKIKSIVLMLKCLTWIYLMHHHNINVCIYNLFILVLNSIMLYMGISNALSKNCLSFVKLGAKYRVQISLCKQGLWYVFE